MLFFAHCQNNVAAILCYGVEQLLQLVQPEMFMYPDVHSQFLSLCGFVAQEYPEQLAEKPPSVLANLVQVVLFGCKSDDGINARRSLQTLAALFEFHVKTVRTGMNKFIITVAFVDSRVEPPLTSCWHI